MRNDAAQFDQRGVAARHRLVFAADPAQRQKQQREEVDEAEDLEKDAPVARLALLVELAELYEAHGEFVAALRDFALGDDECHIGQ